MLFAQKQRINTINTIKQWFINADKKGQGLDKEKLISEICIYFGSTERKAKEYIADLLRSGFIEIDDMGIWLKDKSYINQEIAEADATLRGNNNGN